VFPCCSFLAYPANLFSCFLATIFIRATIPREVAAAASNAIKSMNGTDTSDVLLNMNRAIMVVIPVNNMKRDITVSAVLFLIFIFVFSAA